MKNIFIKLVFSILYLYSTNQVFGQNPLEKLALDINFKDFIWERAEKNDSDPKVQSLRLLVPLESKFTMKGLDLSIDKEKMEILSLLPILEKKETNLSERLILWSINAFQEKYISFYALWEITRSNISKDISDRHVLTMLHDAVVGTDDPNLTSKILVYSGGRLEHVVVKLGGEYLKEGRLDLIGLVKKLSE